MGYAKPNQDASGIHLRQFSRAVVVASADNLRQLVYISLDNGMISTLLRMRVLEELAKKFGAQVYNENNVMLSATHTHSGPGGFFQYLLYNIPSQGFVRETLDALIAGVVLSVERAHYSKRFAQIYYTSGELLDASINRSPTSYDNNPKIEREMYKHNTDKTMHLLRFVDVKTQKPFAMLNWFAVHGTSMNNTNHLISSDNKGYAQILFEQTMNPKGSLPGKGPFVAIFAQANEGDVSPNTAGPRCIDTGLPCDALTSTCNGSNEKCIAFGPGKDMFESTKIIGARQVAKALELFESAQQTGIKLSGPIKFVHEHIDITNQHVALYSNAIELERKHRLYANSKQIQTISQLRESIKTANIRHRRQALALSHSTTNAQQRTNKESNASQIEETVSSNNNNNSNDDVTSNDQMFSTCQAALGFSFAAGTTDGPGAFDFTQGGNENTTALWKAVRNLLRKPSDQLVACQKPKPILLSTGEMDFPYAWHPRIVPTQLLAIGQLVIVGLPGEFTTMSGRRVRAAVQQTLKQQQQQQSKDSAHTSNSNNEHIVVLSGLSNIYTSYIATIEEYDVQRYEGASTLYGPHTLQAYVQQFARLARFLHKDTQPPSDGKLSPPDLSSRQISLKPSVLFDSAPRKRKFGDVLKDVNSTISYHCGDTIKVVFVAGNPRNDLRLGGSYLYVESFDVKTKQWNIVETDASWNTKFIWQRTSTMLGESIATIEWSIPSNCQAGIYRISHFGASKTLLRSIKQYSGRSSNFVVINNATTQYEDQQ